MVTSATRPSPTASDEGVVIYEEDTNKFYVWDGTAWQELDQFINKFRGARAFRSAALSPANGTNTIIGLDAETFDTDAFHDNATNNSRLTVPSGLGGYWLVQGQVSFASNATGRRQAVILKNGTGVASTVAATNGTGSSNTQVATIVAAAAGDFFELQTLQDSGGALALNTGDNNTYLACHRLGT